MENATLSDYNLGDVIGSSVVNIGIGSFNSLVSAPTGVVIITVMRIKLAWRELDVSVYTVPAVELCLDVAIVVMAEVTVVFGQEVGSRDEPFIVAIHLIVAPDFSFLGESNLSSPIARDLDLRDDEFDLARRSGWHCDGLADLPSLRLGSSGTVAARSVHFHACTYG